MSKQIVTVTGPIAPAELGICLTHEHIAFEGDKFCPRPSDPDRVKLYETPMRAEMTGLLRRDPAAVLDNANLVDDDLLAAELQDYRDLGGKSIVEVTPPDVGRDVARLREISLATGLNIVAGSSHYVHWAHPTSVQDESIDQIADRFRTEITEGIDGTGVKSGIIGEVGVSLGEIHPNEEKVLRAAARVQAQTGVAISVHLETSMGPAVLDILEQDGADLTRVVLGHCDVFLSYPNGEESLAFQRELAKRGCYIAYDTFGHDGVRLPPGPLSDTSVWEPSDGMRIKAIVSLIESGLGKQLLMSHDVCMKMNMLKYGGLGYGNILRTIAPELLTLGVQQKEIDEILIENPRRLLAF